MAFTVTLYQYTKKVNSTARPGDSVASLTVQCTPRRGISVMAPVLCVKADTLVNYTYAYIPRYNRYYWITDQRIAPNGLWWLSLSCDVLATYKTSITNSTEYVARSATASDGRVVDQMYPSKAGSLLAMNSKGTPWITDMTTGTFVVGCINDITGASSAAVTYYAMTFAEYSKMITSLQNQTTVQQMLGITVENGIVQGLTGCLENIAYDVYVAQLNPIQYVVSSVYIPLTKSQMTLGASTSVELGRWTIPDLYATTIGYRSTIDCGSLSIPKHPQASSRGDYLNMPPHSTYSTYFPGFGVIELNGARVGRMTSIKAKIVFDPYNGNAYLYLNTNDGDEKEGALGIMTGNIGIPVPVTQMLATDLKGNMIANVAQVASNLVTDKGGVMTAVANSATSMGSWFMQSQNMAALSMSAAGGDMGAGTAARAAELAGGMETAAQGIGVNNPSAILDGVQPIPTLAMAGSPGGSAGLYGQWWIKLEYFQLVDEDNETLGRPLMAIRKLSSLSGFVQCINTHIQCSGATSQETQAVNAAVMNGIFLE